jgi:hypothetical protein
MQSMGSIPTSSLHPPTPKKNYPNLDFWFENILSGNPGLTVGNVKVDQRGVAAFLKQSIKLTIQVKLAPVLVNIAGFNASLN